MVGLPDPAVCSRVRPNLSQNLPWGAAGTMIPAASFLQLTEYIPVTKRLVSAIVVAETQTVSFETVSQGLPLLYRMLKNILRLPS